MISIPRGLSTVGLVGACLVVTSGCAQRRIAVDYAISVGTGFGQQHTKETETFRSGEKFRIRFTTHEDCYAYIFNRGTSGAYNVLFPHPKINGGSNHLPGWQHVIIPPTGAYQFAGQAGFEKFIVCVSDRRLPELEPIVQGQEKDPARIEAILNKLEVDGKRDGKFEKVHHSEHTQVVLESPNKEAVMVNAIQLNHVPAK